LSTPVTSEKKSVPIRGSSDANRGSCRPDEGFAEGGDAKIEEYLASKGVKWEFHPAVPTDQFDVDKSLHNQARHNAVNEERVESYAEAMRRGCR
jgi:hypothetical protein